TYGFVKWRNQGQKVIFCILQLRVKVIHQIKPRQRSSVPSCNHHLSYSFFFSKKYLYDRKQDVTGNQIVLSQRPRRRKKPVVANPYKPNPTGPV
ncbi:hypothetical protein PoMZ_10212, partial [Pyricularia oryzae]